MIKMSELYVPLSQVLDLINITNAANGFSDYHAYLDLFDAVENLPTIEKILDEKHVTEIEADEIPELFPNHAETHSYSAARLKLGNYLYDLELGVRSQVLNESKLIINRIYGYMAALRQVMKLSPSDVHELEEYAERNKDYLLSLLDRYRKDGD